MAQVTTKWMAAAFLTLLPVLASSAQAQTKPLAADMAFRAVAQQATAPEDQTSLQPLCAQQTEGGVITFVADRDGKILLAALSARPLADVRRDIWLTPRFTRAGEAPVPGSDTATEDWAYVYDDNGDGQIDHMAFLIGPLPMEPERRGARLPNILGDRLQIESAAALDQILQAMHFGFWQARDEDGDGVPDSMAMPARRKDNGWYRGWAIFDRRATSEDASCHFMDRDGAPAGSCQAADAPGEYENSKLTAHVLVRDPGPIFSAILEAAATCHITAEQLRPIPSPQNAQPRLSR